MPAPVCDTRDGLILAVRVIPRARRSEVAGVRGDALLVRLAAPPVDGAANAALLVFLADHLDVPRKQVTLLSGERSRVKSLRIDGLSAAVVETRLGLRKEM